MVEQDSPHDLQIFKNLPLEEKMIQYEQGLVSHSRKLRALFQELIDDGRVWRDDFPQHTHYARMSAYYLRTKACHLHNAHIMPPDNINDPGYLYDQVYEGYDVWGRTPMEVDWGRPLRWDEIRIGLVKIFEDNQERKRQGMPIVPKKPERRGCCGK